MTANRLQKLAVERRLDALFKAMSTDFLLREQFITDPSQVMAEFVQGTRLSAETASNLNHLIYSIVANRGLMTWLRRYAIQHNSSQPTLNQFLQDFSQAIIEHKGDQVVSALMHGSLENRSLLNSEHLESSISGTLQIFGPGPDRPGSVLGGNETWTEDTGTIFTAGGTVGDTLTVTDLETWHTGTDDTGTESTGTETTGTETTGTETEGEISIGSEFDFSQSNYVVASLTALAQYAAQLSRVGALDIER